MDSYSRISHAVASAAVVTALALACSGASAQGKTAHVPPTPIVQEDSPAWDCMTMGNSICGIPLVRNRD